MAPRRQSRGPAGFGRDAYTSPHELLDVRSQDGTATAITGIAARVQDAFSGTALPSD
jgi:hypothetical protein